MASYIDDLIYQEQIRLLYKNTGLMVTGQLLVASIIYLVFWPQLPLTTLFLWAVAFLALTRYRFYSYRAFQEIESEIFDAGYWEKKFVVGTAFVGGLWGLLFYLLLSFHHEGFLILVFTLFTGVVAGASTYLSANFRAFLTFLAPATLPLSIGLIMAGQTTLAILGILYFIVLVFLTLTYYRSIREGIQLRFENIELISQLKTEKQRAEQAILVKDRFLAAASHDLRQPLHAQSLYIDALENNVSGLASEQLEALRKTNEALSNLFNNLLDVSRLNAGIVEINPVHVRLQDLLRPIVEEHQVQANAKQLQLSMVCPPERVALIDTTLLERIVRNLLSNAIRYTRQGGISINCDSKSKNTLTLSVCDTGIGIPEDELDNIFQEYHQLHNPERDRDKGLGLGLAIVKKLCELMKLHLHCQSRPDEGSCFSIDMPRGSAHKIAAVDEATIPNPVNNAKVLFNGAKVLVIDDETTILSGMQQSLSRWGFEVVTAESAEQAQAKLGDSASIQLIVADYRLRDEKTGVEAIHGIRCFLNNEDIPGIIITGDTSGELLQETKESGFVLLHKPVTPGVLRNTLNIMLESG